MAAADWGVAVVAVGTPAGTLSAAAATAEDEVESGVAYSTLILVPVAVWIAGECLVDTCHGAHHPPAMLPPYLPEHGSREEPPQSVQVHTRHHTQSPHQNAACSQSLLPVAAVLWTLLQWKLGRKSQLNRVVAEA